MPSSVLASDWKRFIMPKHGGPKQNCSIFYLPLSGSLSSPHSLSLYNLHRKAVNYRIQKSHLNSSAFCDVVTPTGSEEETVVESELEERLHYEETRVDDHGRIEGIYVICWLGDLYGEKL